MQQKVLIAVGNKSYSDILTETFRQHPQFLLSTQEVLHRRFLKEIMELERPDLLIVHDYYLESDFMRQEKKDEELISFFKKLRVQYDESIRVVFLCERPKGDPFLSTLVGIGVLDIFNTNSFDLNEFIQQLSEKPRFSRVEKFFISPTAYAMPGEMIEEPTQEEVEVKLEPEAKKEKVIVQKVIEKKVVQKVVNKNVIKRDYKIQITTNTEKIVGIPVNKKLIMIGNLNPRNGSTFISHLLVRALTQLGVKAAYVESPFSRAYTYDRFIGHQVTKEYRSKFSQFSKSVETEKQGSFEWSRENVEIICKHPTKEPIYKENDVSFENLIKVLFSSQSTITIMDIGFDWEYELFQDVFDIADHVYFVIEPDIPSIQYFEESHSEIALLIKNHLAHDKSSLIANRSEQSSVMNNLLNDLYGEKIKAKFPSFSDLDVFEAQFKGLFLNDHKDYHKKLELYMQPLITEILPADFLKQQQKGKGLFNRLFQKKKITVEKTEERGAVTTP